MVSRSLALRGYQLQAIAQARAAFAEHRAVCLVLPVGAGKTVVASEIARLTVERGKRVLFLVHRRELVDQAVARLAANGIEAGVIMAGVKPTRSSVQVASIPTLIRRPLKPPAQLVIFDECHHTPSASWERLAKHYAASAQLGLTATPFRLDGKGIGRVFSTIVAPIGIRDLIEAGHLVEPTVYAPPPPDLSGIRTRGGDYSDLELLGGRMSKLTGDIFAHWRRHADGLRTVAFACTVEHSKHIRDTFQAAGVPAAHLDASTKRPERERVLADLAAGRVRVVSNVQILTEGWDLPALRCAIMARPTKALSLHHQMTGRVMRPPGPVLVLDHAGNVHEHGLVTDAFEVTLTDRVQKKPGVAPVKTCPECYLALPASAKECECGYVFDVSSPIPMPADGRLGVYVRAEDPRAVYADLVRTASGRGFSIGWARFRFKARFGKWPAYYALESELYRCEGHEWEISKWGERCKRCKRKRSVVGA
ncbi:MAG TPA: DEAD/DEAH box helicase family protein [Phycisphaerae bacterium]|nr:DEAD/DEAH box helicase family protein [Phycisphaerae bacterium]